MAEVRWPAKGTKLRTVLDAFMVAKATGKKPPNDVIDKRAA